MSEASTAEGLIIIDKLGEQPTSLYLPDLNVSSSGIVRFNVTESGWAAEFPNGKPFPEGRIPLQHDPHDLPIQSTAWGKHPVDLYFNGGYAGRFQVWLWQAGSLRNELSLHPNQEVRIRTTTIRDGHGQPCVRFQNRTSGDVTLSVVRQDQKVDEVFVPKRGHRIHNFLEAPGSGSILTVGFSDGERAKATDWGQTGGTQQADIYIE